MNYVPLYVKSDYSILKSLIKIDDLIEKLISYDIKACALCDDDLYGTMEFYKKCRENNIKPIIGLEVNLDYTLLLYAKNYKGYQNLCNINTLKNEGLLNLEKLYEFLSDIIVVIPFCYKEYFNEIKKYSSDVFIGFSSKEEYDLIDVDKVYIKKYLTLDKSYEKYLPFLYKIDDNTYDFESNVTLEGNVPIEFTKTTMFFINKIDLVIPKNNFLLPVYNSDDNFNYNKYLTDLCIIGLKKRLNDNVTKDYIDRLKHELNIIIKMGFSNYFLVVWDYVKYAKRHDILVGPGRGSAASSLVSYSLGITDIDPLKYDLLFERFLNPDRVTMPDIDIDFDADKRDQVIDYVTNKYGKDKVCQIVTFSNLLAKQVIRDLARILNVSSYKIDNLVKSFNDKSTLKKELDNISVRKILNSDEELRKLYDIALHLEGIKRHTSIHAAGVIISSKTLRNYVPLLTDSSGNYLCGYTMNYIEDLGLLKMDFLSLKNLSLVDSIIKKVGISFNDIPLDDKKTYELFSLGLLDGIFQFESNGMKKFITDLKPTNINDLIDAVALFRPGPIDNIPLYIKRRNGKEKTTYINEKLESILKSTYGIIIYQEQIMQIASSMASFSYAKADMLRRAMSKKKEDLLLSYRNDFILGSINNGYSKKEAMEVYDLIEKFANYGFNKAHSVSYAIIGYKIAYLKVHYPLVFMCEMLNNSIGNKQKIKKEIDEAKVLNINVLKPSINLSTSYYEVKDNNILSPFSIIKDIGVLSSNRIVNERCDNGTYKSYIDFVKRNYKLGKDVIRNIILSGALDEFGYNKKTLIENMDLVIDYADISSDLDDSSITEPELDIKDEYGDDFLTKSELDIYGYYISNHPTNRYINDNSITTKVLDKYFDRNIKIALYFERKREITTKNNEKMMFIEASDSFGRIDVVLFPKTYQRYFNISFSKVYMVTGRVEKRFSKMQIVASLINEVD